MDSISGHCYVISLKYFSNKNITYTYTIKPYGYNRFINTSWSPDVGVKLAIYYDINSDIEDLLYYKPRSVETIYSNKYIKKISPSYHILYPLYLDTEPTDQSNTKNFWSQMYHSKIIAWLQ